LRKILIFLSLISFSFAIDYVSKIEPYKSYKVSSQSSGEIEFIKDVEFSFVDDLIIQLDDENERIQKEALKSQIEIQNKIVKIKKRQYLSKKEIKRLSEYEKLTEELNYLNAKNTLLNLKQSLDVINNQIKKKRVFANNLYVGKIYAKEKMFVNAGFTLFDAYDISKLAIELFVTKEDLENIKNKDIYIDGKKSSFKIEKISNIKDSVNISTYYVKLIKENSDKNYKFSNLVKVEFKDKK